MLPVSEWPMTSVSRIAMIILRPVIYLLLHWLIVGKLAPWACRWEWLQCIEACETPAEPIVVEIHTNKIDSLEQCFDDCQKGFITCHTDVS